MSITAKAFFHPARKPTSTDVEDRFFSDLRTRNSTFKRTASDRFHDPVSYTHLTLPTKA